MVLVKICKLQLIIFYQFYPPIATSLQRIIRGIYLYYNKNLFRVQERINKKGPLVPIPEHTIGYISL